MFDPRWMGPPEIIAATFEAGPGPASTLANQVVWVTEVVNHELVVGVSAGNTAATSAQWLGLGGVASAATATELNAGLQTLVGWISHKVAVTQVAVEAFAVAASTVIPSLVCQANRDEWAVLNATNFLGINTPAIVGLDTEYFGEHYPHNSGIGWTYSAALGALAATLALPPPIGAPAAPAAAGEAGEALAQTATGAVADDLGIGPGGAAGPAVDDAAATAGGADVTGLGSQLPQLFSGLTQPFQQIGQAPAQLAQTAAGPAQSLVGSFGSFSGGMFPAAPGAAGIPSAAVPTAAGPESAAPVEPWRTGTVTPAGPGSVGGYPLGLTRYTQPSNSFAPENAGRPSSLPAGLLDATPGRVAGRPGGPPVAGAGMPVSPLGALHREPGDTERDTITRARIVVAADRHDR